MHKDGGGELHEDKGDDAGQGYVLEEEEEEKKPNSSSSSSSSDDDQISAL